MKVLLTEVTTIWLFLYLDCFCHEKCCQLIVYSFFWPKLIVCSNLYFTDVVLARVETEKRLSLIRAWEENEKSKADNKYGIFLIIRAFVICNLSLGLMPLVNSSRIDGFWMLNLEVKSLYRAQKKLSAIGSWEDSQKASVEAELKRIEVTCLCPPSRSLARINIHFGIPKCLCKIKVESPPFSSSSK